MAGKHRRAENTRVRAFPGRIRRGILLFAAVILLMGTVGSSLAFLSTGTEEKENTFQTAKLSCRVNENYVFPNKEKVNVENTCAYPVFVRVKLLPYWYDKDKDVVVANTAWTPDFQPGEGWVKDGGYYYYTEPVAPGEKTSDLIKNIKLAQDDITLARQVLEIMAQCIQTDGQTAGGGGAAAAAWGVDPTDLG